MARAKSKTDPVKEDPKKTTGAEETAKEEKPTETLVEQPALAQETPEQPEPEAAEQPDSQPEQPQGSTSDTDSANDTPDAANAVDSAENTPEDEPETPAEEDKMYRYMRKTGFRAAEIGGTVYNPGDVLESDTPGAIPDAFMDGWEVLNEPGVGPVKLPSIVPVEGGFDVYTADGRKLNDKPVGLKRAQELVDGLNS